MVFIGRHELGATLNQFDAQRWLDCSSIKVVCPPLHQLHALLEAYASVIGASNLIPLYVRECSFHCIRIMGCCRFR